MEEVSPTDVWLTTATDRGAHPTVSRVYQWDGTNLVLQTAPTGPAGTTAAFAGISVASATAPVFVVGSSTNSGGVQNSLADIRAGTTWAEHDPRASTDSHWLSAVASASASSVWAVGNRHVTGGTDNLLDFWNGSSWTEYGGPNPIAGKNHLYGVAAVPGTSQFWAVGQTGRKTPILLCCS